MKASTGRLRALSVSHSKSMFDGGFVWARSALYHTKRRLPAPRAAACLVHDLRLQKITSPRSTVLNGGCRPGQFWNCKAEEAAAVPAWKATARRAHLSEGLSVLI
jgi:hypothetical protein